MQNEKVRRVTVGHDKMNCMNYTVGSAHAIPSPDKKDPDMLTISSIEETEHFLLIYLKHGDDSVQLWKKVPKNQFTTVEYFID